MPLTDLDLKILKTLLKPDGKTTSALLSQKLGVPLSTIQRRRKKLEKEYVSIEYSMNPAKFGWRSIALLIYTMGGHTRKVADALLSRKEVVYAARTVGEHSIDLRVDIFVKDNAELLDILEEVKAMEGVRDVIWTEVVEVLGKKRPPNHILDSMIRLGLRGRK